MLVPELLPFAMAVYRGCFHDPTATIASDWGKRDPGARLDHGVLPWIKKNPGSGLPFASREEKNRPTRV